MAEISQFRLHPGAPAPPFSLPGVDGKVHSLHDFDGSRFLLVVFWCNHCPYVQAWEGRMLALAREYAAKGVATVLINANDEGAYPDDRMERMVARAAEKGYLVPYLRDGPQEVAHAYGALVTPHPMLFGPDRRLIYQGRIDDNHENPSAVRHHDLQSALDDAIAGRPLAKAELPVLGCSVKWRN
ncbi:MAG: thioredoxin family protein [Thermoplasmata archaeon]|nr:thioredoxin family protein [Thermoplasmata archaeon]